MNEMRTPVSDVTGESAFRNSGKKIGGNLRDGLQSGIDL
jgi:hypothetical protein